MSTPAGSFDDVDATPIVLRCLQRSERLAAVGLTEAHVSGIREAPWPHLQVESGDTEFGDPTQGPMVDESRMTLWGHPDGSTSPALLKRLGRVAADVVLELQHDVRELAPREAIVSRVRILSGPTLQVLTSGQRRVVSTAELTLRPQS